MSTYSPSAPASTQLTSSLSMWLCKRQVEPQFCSGARDHIQNFYPLPLELPRQPQHLKEKHRDFLVGKKNGDLGEQVLSVGSAQLTTNSPSVALSPSPCTKLSAMTRAGKSQRLQSLQSFLTALFADLWNLQICQITSHWKSLEFARPASSGQSWGSSYSQVEQSCSVLWPRDMTYNAYVPSVVNKLSSEIKTQCRGNKSGPQRFRRINPTYNTMCTVATQRPFWLDLPAAAVSTSPPCTTTNG